METITPTMEWVATRSVAQQIGTNARAHVVETLRSVRTTIHAWVIPAAGVRTVEIPAQYSAQLVKSLVGLMNTMHRVTGSATPRLVMQVQITMIVLAIVLQISAQMQAWDILGAPPKLTLVRFNAIGRLNTCAPLLLQMPMAQLTILSIQKLVWPWAPHALAAVLR